MAATEHMDRQARIAALESELGLEPMPILRVTHIAHQIEQLAQQAEALLAQTRRLRATVQDRASDDQVQVMVDIDRQMAEITQALQVASQELQQEVTASVSAPRERVVDIRVITEGRNRWLVQVRRVVGEGVVERIWEFRLAGWRNRKVARSLIKMAERSRSSAG